MVVSFFGHKDTPTDIKPVLKSKLIQLIEQEQADTFYVGNNGNFDRMSEALLAELILIYPHIQCYVVLAYLPVKKSEHEYLLPTVFPEGLETVPKRFAINFRNKWMVEQSDCVVSYVMHNWGGAAKFVRLAEKKGKSSRHAER